MLSPLVLALAVAAPPSVPWDLVDGARGLSDSERARFVTVTSETASYGECKKSILTCLRARPPDPVAVRLASFTAWMVRRELPEDAMRRVLDARRALAHPDEVHRFEVAGRPALGRDDALITIVELADFECPYCRVYDPLIRGLVKRSGGRVRLVFLHFPLNSHPQAERAARAAEAAHRQGRFWPMHDRLYAHPFALTRADLLAHARAVGCDMKRFEADFDAPAVAAQVKAERAAGDAAGVRGTPAFFVNGKRYRLSLEPEVIEDVLEEEAARLGVELVFENEEAAL